MTAQTLISLLPVLPALILGSSALGLLMIGVGYGTKGLPLVSHGSIMMLILATLSTFVILPVSPLDLTFGNLIISDAYVRFAQMIILLATTVVLLASFQHLKQDRIDYFEYPILVLFSCAGMVLLVAANDLLMMFVALELQSLPIYALVAMRRSDTHASEAAVKYFVLGVLASVFILYGSSFIYGYTGTTDFQAIVLTFNEFINVPIPLVLAIVLLTAGLAFKISAVPFHMWTPDVYEGSPTPVTLFIASAPKIAAMVFIIRLLFGPLGQFVDNWQPLIQALAILSMVIGTITALFQVNIKRLLAYSTISHMGYALVGVASGSPAGVQGVLIYLVLYTVMIVGTFACLLNLRRHGKMPLDIDDLRGLSKIHPKMALALAILMFSLGGIPPLAGFFGKLFVFMAAIDANLYLLVIIGAMTTVIGMGYYLRIVKVMYFDDSIGDDATMAYDQKVSQPTVLVIIAAILINLLFFVWPQPMINKADQAALSLFDNE